MSATVRRQQVRYAHERGVSLRRGCRPALGGAFDARLRIGPGPARSAGDRSDARARYSVPALRVSQDPSVPRAAWNAHEHGSSASDLASSRAPGASAQAAATHRHGKASAARAGWSQPGLAYDFVFDACANGQTLKCLTVLDEFTRECPAIDVGGSIRSSRVIEVLSKLVSVRGAPRYLRSDNGSEFISRAILRWLADKSIETALIDPGKPWQNGSNESFNGKLRDQCLGMQWFKNRVDAKVLIEAWRREYNEVRPHSSLGQLTPTEFAARMNSSVQPGAVF